MDWSSIQYVTSGLTLIAFLLMIIGTIVLSAIKRDRKLIQSAPEDKREKLIGRILDPVQVKTDNLTRQQKFELVNKKLNQRYARFRLTIRAGLIALVILAGLTSFAIFEANPATIDSVTIVGVVKDKGFKPIHGAKVTAVGHDHSAISEFDGSFKLKINRLSKGYMLKLRFLHDQYHTESQNIEVSDSSINLQDIILRQ